MLVFYNSMAPLYSTMTHLYAIPLTLLLATTAMAEPVVITGYSPEVAQTDSTPFIARCGPVRSGTLALSRDLWRRYRLRCGQVVTLVVSERNAHRLGVGHILTWLRMLGLRVPRRVHVEFIVWDTMAPRKTEWADILFWVKEKALAWGKRRGHLVVERRGR